MTRRAQGVRQPAARRHRWLRARLWTLRHERGLTRAGIRRAAALWRYSYDPSESPEIDQFRLSAGLTHADMEVASRIVRELDMGRTTSPPPGGYPGRCSTGGSDG